MLLLPSIYPNKAIKKVRLSLKHSAEISFYSVSLSFLQIKLIMAIKEALAKISPLISITKKIQLKIYRVSVLLSMFTVTLILSVH